MKFNKAFNLENDVLFKTAKLNTGDKSILVFCIHHIIADGTSLGVLIKDFINIYNGIVLSEQKYYLKEYTSWINQFHNTEVYKKQKEYWLMKK